MNPYEWENDPNISTAMDAESLQKLLNPLGSDGYKCQLPIPFVRGSPANVEKMTLEELRVFIRFAYGSQYNKSLADRDPNVRKEKPPVWWPRTVTFDKFLQVVGVKNQDSTKIHQRELIKVIHQFYNAYGMLLLIFVAQELSVVGNTTSVILNQDKNGVPWKIVRSEGRLMLLIDAKTWTYDQEACYFSSTINHAHITRTSKVRENVRPTKVQIARRGRKKRKLFDFEDEDSGGPFFCKYCHKEFKWIDFCEDHEMACLSGPASRVSQHNFMATLGMQNKSEPKTDINEKSETDAPPQLTDSSGSHPPRRVLRKNPKRNQLISTFKNHRLPISSERGQKLLKLFDEKCEDKFPPSYEKACESRSRGLVGAEDKTKFLNVAKRTIEKDGEWPHIYTFGRRQRELRNQELVIGLNCRKWKLLNQMKKARVVVTKLKPFPPTRTLTKKEKKPYIEHQLRAAMVLPHVKLVDIKHLVPKIPKVEIKKEAKPPPPPTSPSLQVGLWDCMRYPSDEVRQYMKSSGVDLK